MAHKSNIRKTVESIIGRNIRQVYIDATSKKKLKYRMKLVGVEPFTSKVVKQLMKLPNVIGIDYEDNKISYEGKLRGGYFRGAVVYFNCRPSLINI